MATTNHLQFAQNRDEKKKERIILALRDVSTNFTIYFFFIGNALMCMLNGCVGYV